MDELSTRLAANLKSLREAKSLSQKALAEQSGVPRPTIAHLESGQANPTLSVALRVARALGIRLDELVDPGESPIRVFPARSLPTERSARVRRVQLAPAGTGVHGGLERVVLKVGGRLHLDPEGVQEVLVCERGEFMLVCGPLEVPLTVDHVAILRTATECVAQTAGVLYRLS